MGTTKYICDNKMMFRVWIELEVPFKKRLLVYSLVLCLILMLVACSGEKRKHLLWLKNGLWQVFVVIRIDLLS